MKQRSKEKRENPFQKFRRNMKGLSFEEKIDHIWTYYRGTVILMILVPLLLGMVISIALQKKPAVAFAGNFTNATLSAEGQSYLVNDWFSLLNLEPGSAEIKINFTETAGNDLGAQSAQGVDGGVQVALSVAANDLDYIVCDQVGVEFFAAELAFLPLNEVFTSEQLAEYESILYYYTDAETGERSPAALRMTEQAFFRDCVDCQGEVYLMFANKDKPFTERISLFMEHLQAWGRES